MEEKKQNNYIYTKYIELKTNYQYMTIKKSNQRGKRKNKRDNKTFVATKMEYSLYVSRFVCIIAYVKYKLRICCILYTIIYLLK